jgi:hypothetical protein
MLAGRDFDGWNNNDDRLHEEDQTKKVFHNSIKVDSSA